MTDQEIAPASSSIETLRARLRGAVLTPAEPEYDRARRVWNGAIDTRPLAIARCRGVEDVRNALTWAQAAEVPVSVRSGGHGAHGLAVRGGGLVLDLREMSGVEVDTTAAQVRVQGGAPWGAVYEATAPHGLAPAGGTDTRVGAVGFTTGGSGNAWLMRRHGLGCDNVISFELLTADGQLRTVDENDGELFWAMKGAGPNFGVITAMTLRLFPVPERVITGAVFFDAEHAEATLAGYRDTMRAASRDTQGMWLRGSFPNTDEVPEPLRGRDAVFILLMHVGPLADAERVAAAFRSLAPPLLDTIAEAPLSTGLHVVDGYAPDGYRYYMKGSYVHSLDDAAISTALPVLMQTPELSAQIFWMEGAVNDFPLESAAIPRDGRKAYLGIVGAWTDPTQSERIVPAAEAANAAFSPWISGADPNHSHELSPEQLRDAIGSEIYDRLRDLKRTIDPDNVFSANQNILP